MPTIHNIKKAQKMRAKTETSTELRATDEESQTEDNAFEDDSERDTIAGYETRLVQYSKAIFITAIVIVAVTLGCITFLSLRSGEEQAYIDHVSVTPVVL